MRWKKCSLSITKEKAIPLSYFAKWQPANAPLSVNHQGLSAASTISFNLPTGKSLSDASAAIDRAMTQLGVPSTVRGSFAGTAQVFQETMNSQVILIIAAIATVYIVLGILYESYVHPLTILSTLPSAGVGALLALELFNAPFSLIALIGIMLLIGIVKKNAIMMVDFALEAQRQRQPAAGRSDLPGLSAALPADYDDHPGGAVRRAAAGVCRAATARSLRQPLGDHHCRRPGDE